MKRRFIIGEEWLYLKLYAGPKILEEILLNEIYPVIKHLFSSGVISHFFFVRYVDDGYHLRLRFKLIDRKKSDIVLNILSERLKLYSENRVLSKVIADTYNREVERYGDLAIEDTEALFSFNSLEILYLLKITENNYKSRWLYGIKLMDLFLTQFALNTKEKYELYQYNYLSFSSEFTSDKNSKDELKRLYREESKSIEDVLAENFVIPQIEIVQPNEAVLSSVKRIMELGKEDLLPGGLHKFLSNLLHMHYNRLFRIKQRSHEFVISYMMSNFYKSQLIIAQKP